MTLFSATGGTKTTDGLYTVHKFVLADTGTNLVCTETLTGAEVLVVAGGGGGGSGSYSGGGGAGGLVEHSNLTLTGNMTVTVGAGGASPLGSQGSSGGNSVFGGITALGGGGGGNYDDGPYAGVSGGCGGGGSSTNGTAGATTQGSSGGGTGYGFAGGTGTSQGGAGGGGAGGAGSNGNYLGGNGGAGRNSNILSESTNITYASGGAGCAEILKAQSGTNGLGNGGAASGQSGISGGVGGSGVVIIRYLTPANYDRAEIQAAVDALGTGGGTIVLAATTYTLDGPILLPAGNTAITTFSGYGTTLSLTATTPRAFVWNRTSTHLTFKKFTFEGITVNANGNHPASDQWSVFGFDAYYSGSYDYNGAYLNIEEVIVKDCTVTGVPTTNPVGNNSYNAIDIHFASQHFETGGTENHITDILVQNCVCEGGERGVNINGYGPAPLNINIDRVYIRDCWHDTLLTPTYFGSSTNYHIGQSAHVGTCEITNCYGNRSQDCGIEVDQSSNGLVKDCVMENSLTGMYYYTHFNSPLTGDGSITFEDCVAYCDLLGVDEGQGFSFNADYVGYDLGNVDIINCIVTNNATTGWLRAVMVVNIDHVDSFTVNGLYVSGTSTTGEPLAEYIQTTGVFGELLLYDIIINGEVLYDPFVPPPEPPVPVPVSRPRKRRPTRPVPEVPVTPTGKVPSASGGITTIDGDYTVHKFIFSEEDSGANYPSTAISVSETPFDDIDWNTINNIKIDDTSYASITDAAFDNGTYSYSVTTGDYKFDIDDDNTIIGVKVEMMARCSAGTAVPSQMNLVSGGSITGDAPVTYPASLTGTDTIHVFGGPTELWSTDTDGPVALTPAVVNDADFGFKFAIGATSADTDIYVEYVRMTIYYHTGSGHLVVDGTIGPADVEVLLVGGGGGGSNGGGGGGGFISSTSVVLTGSMPVVVGNGGAPGATDTSAGTHGGETTFAGLTAYAGGGAARYNDTAPLWSNHVFGSGGGGGSSSSITRAGSSGTAPQGYDGGTNGGNYGGSYPAGGGGGAAAVGGNASSTTVAGNGGSGHNSDIVLRGTNVGYAGGGGGGIYANTAGTASHGGGAGSTASSNGTDGTANTGGGGGGCGTTKAGGRGGGGIVVVRYLTPVRKEVELKLGNWRDKIQLVITDPVSGTVYNLTEEATNITYSTAQYVGYSSLNFSVSRDKNIEYEDIEYGNLVRVYYGGNQIVWSGRIEDPGRITTGHGITFTVSCYGMMNKLKDDECFKRIFLDEDIGQWQWNEETDEKGIFEYKIIDGGNTGNVNKVVLKTRVDYLYDTDDYCDMYYWIFDGTYNKNDPNDSSAQTEKIWRMEFDYDVWLAGNTNNAWRASIRVIDGNPANMGVTGGSQAREWVSTAGGGNESFSGNDAYEVFAGVTGIVLRLRKYGGVNNESPGARNVCKLSLSNIKLFGVDPANLSGTTEVKQITARSIVNNVVSNDSTVKKCYGFFDEDHIVMDGLDDTNVDTTDIVDETFSFRDYTTRASVLDDLNAGMGWDYGVYDDDVFYYNDPNLHKTGEDLYIVSSKDPNIIRYEIKDSYDECCVEVIVRYMSKKRGVQKEKLVDITDLSDLGIDDSMVSQLSIRKRKVLDLGDTRISSSLAQKIGKTYLTEHYEPQPSGQITASGYITNGFGVPVPIHNVRSGQFLVCRDIQHDRQKDMKIVSTTVNLDDNSISIELGRGPDKIEKLIGRLVLQKRRRSMNWFL